jgi:tetratricopeptide (TPR) repeat protein
LDALAQASASSGQWFELAETISQHLPGAKTPLTPADLAIVGQYRTKPLEVYDTMPKARGACDRESWAEATARALSARSAEPNTDLANLAKDAAKLLPDRPELALQFLRQWAEVEASHVTSLPASQVRRLAETVRVQLGDHKRSQEILRQWLDARRKKLGTRDADGRVRLAKDYRADLKDYDSAAKLLLEAIQIESDLPEAATELKALGYVKTSTGWKAGADPLAAPTATSSRLPEKNMTTDQVRNIMGDTRPGDRIRFAYRKDGRLQVIEQWTYRGPPDLYVVFQFVSDVEARVIAINTPPQK